MKKKSVLIYFQVIDTLRQYRELFPYSELNDKYNVVESVSMQNNLNENFLIKLSFITKKIHSFLHFSELKRRRFSTLSYLQRSNNYYPNRFDFQPIKIRNFEKKSSLEQIIILFFSNTIGVNIIKFFLIYFFKIEYLISRNKYKDFSLFILPYTGGISAEWDFLVWVAKQKKINSIAIQENWDNLSSKQFLFQFPTVFLVFGNQSGSHLRTLHFYRGDIFEIGCLRLQELFDLRNNDKNLSKTISRQILDSVTNILYVDSGVSSGDLKILSKLSEYLDVINICNGNRYKVVYRTHPKVQNTIERQKFFNSIKKLPNIELYQPSLDESNSERLSQLYNAHIIISIFSTYILEGSILNKKCIIPTFWVDFENHSPIKIVDDITHFHGISLLSGVNMAPSFHNFIELIDSNNYKKSWTNDLKILRWFCEDVNTKNQIVDIVKKYI